MEVAGLLTVLVSQDQRVAGHLVLVVLAAVVDAVRRTGVVFLFTPRLIGLLGREYSSDLTETAQSVIRLTEKVLISRLRTELILLSCAS